MTNPERVAHRPPRARDIATAVVAEHPLSRHAAGVEPRDRPLQEGGARGAELIVQHLDIGQAAMVIDGDMHVLQPYPPTGAAAIAVNPMAHLADAPERLDVDVQQVAGAGHS